MTVGYLYGYSRLNGNTLNIVNVTALAHGIDFFFFKREDVNKEGKTINAWVWDSQICDYVRKVKPYPDIVEVAGIISGVRRELGKDCVLTVLHSLRDKIKSYDVLRDGGYARYLIDSQFYNSTDIDDMLQRHKEIIIKPNGGSEASGIYKLSKEDDKYRIQPSGGGVETLAANEYSDKYSQIFDAKKTPCTAISSV